MGAFRLAEHGAEEPVVKVDDLIDQRGLGIEDHRHERRMPPRRLKVTQMLRSHLAALTGEFREPAAVHGGTSSGRDSDRTNRFQSLHVREDMPGPRRPRWLAKPTEPADLAPSGHDEKIIKRRQCDGRDRLDELGVHPPGSAGQRFAADPLDHLYGGNNDALRSKTLNDGFGQSGTPIGALGQLSQSFSPLPVIGQIENAQPEPGLELGEMLEPGLLPGGVLDPFLDRNVELAGECLK